MSANLPEITPGMIRTVRRMRGLTQRQAAEQLGIHPITLCRWESGKHKPMGVHLSLLERWARGDTPYLTDGEG